MMRFVLVAISVFMLSPSSWANVPAWITADVQVGETVGRVVVAKTSDVSAIGRWRGGSVGVVEDDAGFWSWKVVDVSGNVLLETDPAAPDLLGMCVSNLACSVTPIEVEWVGFDPIAAAWNAGQGLIVAFVLHTGCVMCAWFIGDFSDVIGWGMR